MDADDPRWRHPRGDWEFVIDNTKIFNIAHPIEYLGFSRLMLHVIDSLRRATVTSSPPDL